MATIDSLTKAFAKSLTLADKPDANVELTAEFKPTGLNEVQDAELRQWFTLSNRFPDTLEQLNNALKERTFLLSTQELSLADVVVFSRVLPIVKSWTDEEVIANRHVVRWADLVQNTIAVDESNKIKVNVDLSAPREIKAKPEKKKDVTAEAAADKKAKKEKAAPAVESAPADAPATATPATEAASEVPAEASGEKKGVKKEKKKKEQPPPKEEAPITPGMIDLRVGFIEKAIKHPDADALYVSTIHMGDEEGPRTVCSGLVKYFPLEAMQERFVIVVANLKPVTMRGIKSSAMVLCASNEDTVEFVNPPPGSKAGDKIFFEGYDITPEPVLNPKKKVWETIQPGFTTTESLNVIFKKEGDEDRKLVNKAGEVCLVNTLVSANVR